MSRAIAAELLNEEGKPEVRCGGASTLRLSLTNQTGEGLSPALFQLSLAPLFPDPAAQAGLAVTAPDGWTAAYEPASQSWALRPRPGFALPSGKAQLVTIAGVRPHIPVGQALLTLLVTGGDQERTRVTVPLMVLPSAAPGERDLADALGARLGTRRRGGGVDHPEVAVSRRPDEVERSDLILTLYNRTGAPLVAGEWGPWPPTLTLVFDTADGPPGHYALTTARRLDDIEVAVEQGTGWRVVKRSPGPEWDIVVVPVEGRRHVLAPGAFAELSIRGLTTNLAPGPTLVELRSHGFPGFADGVRTFIVDKRYAPMRIAEPLDANAAMVELSPEGSATVELTWKVEHASLVQLSGVGEVPSATDGYEVSVTRDTMFVLTAYDAMLGEVLTDRIAIAARQPAAEALPVALLPRGAILGWTGAEAPKGFALCDGSVEGVPDLRGRFIVGAGRAADGPDAEPGDQGGGDAHSHDFPSAKVQAAVEPEGEHVHRPPVGWGGVTLKRGGWSWVPGVADRVPVLIAPNPAGTSSVQDPHVHPMDPLDLDIAVDGSEPPAPRPPWFALSYIMKL